MSHKWPDILPQLKMLLTPPGSGVHTVHTNRERKLRLQERIYGIKGDESEYLKIWQQELVKIPLAPKCLMLGVPSDCGGGIQRGANWGPMFIRDQLISSKEELPYFDLGDIRVVPHLLEDRLLNQETINKVKKALYGDSEINLPVAPLTITELVCDMIYDCFPSKGIFALGGDHSVSYPLVKSWLKRGKRKNKKCAILHFDAHTDLSSERLGVDVCFGSWAYHILPHLESPAHLVQVGIRSSGKDKEHWEKTLGIKQYWARELEQDISGVSQKIVNHFKQHNIDEIYISFDIDCLDITYAGATGTPEKDGPAPHAPMLIMQDIFENFKITGADLVEVAPMVRAPEVNGIEPETTLMMAQALSSFLIGAL